MPRIVSWYINISHEFVPASWVLEMCSPMYDLIGVDQWSYYAVNANADRSNVLIKQNSRFGIGDIYFLSMFYGKCTHLVDDISEVGYRSIHLKSGRRLDDISAMLKVLGFTGEWENDRLMKSKEQHGFWCHGDHRRYVVAEPIGVDANNFASTSFSPGAVAWSDMHMHMVAYPKDWQLLRDQGALPVHKADLENDRPAYVVDARHGSFTGIAVNAAIPMLAERSSITGPWKRLKMMQCHPLDKFLDAARKEWDSYVEQFKSDCRYDHIVPPSYPYTLDYVNRWMRREEEHYQKMQSNVEHMRQEQMQRLEDAGRQIAAGKGF